MAHGGPDYAHLEQDAVAFDALAQFLHFFRREAVGPVRDFEQHGFQLIQHAGDARIAGARGGLAVQPVLGHQVAGALAVRR